jgi:hypothetical protein
LNQDECGRIDPPNGERRHRGNAFLVDDLRPEQEKESRIGLTSEGISRKICSQSGENQPR